MKVNQIVSEHKKGVKAKKYAKKPQPLIGVDAQKKAAEKRQADAAKAKAKPATPAPVNEAVDQQQVYSAHQEMREKNPQYAAEVAKLPGMIRGIGPDAQRHNKMVWDEIAKILQKYKALPVQEELPGQTPGQEIGTVVGQPNSQGEVTVKKQDGSTALINQQLLQPGQQPNTFQMPTQAIPAGAKVMAGPVTQGAQAMESVELTDILRIAGLK
jgi:hypothetical protein